MATIPLDYIPDVNDETEPQNGRSAGKGAEEIRLLKQKVKSLAGGNFTMGGVPPNSLVFGPRYRMGSKSYATDATINNFINKSLHFKCHDALTTIVAGTTKVRLAATALNPVYLAVRNGFGTSGYVDNIIKQVTNVDADVLTNAHDVVGLMPVILAKTNASRTAIDSLLMTHQKPFVDYDWPRQRGSMIDQLETIAAAGATSLVDYFGNNVVASSAAATTQVKLGSDGKLWLWVAGSAVNQRWTIGDQNELQELLTAHTFEIQFDWYTDSAITNAKFLFSVGLYNATAGARILSVDIDVSGTSKFKLAYSPNSDGTSATAAFGTTTVLTNTKYTIRVVKVGSTLRLYANNNLEVTLTMSKPDFEIPAGARMQLGDPNNTFTTHPGSYFKNFVALPGYIGPKPGSYALDDLQWIEKPLFVDKITGKTYKVTARATGAQYFPTLTEENYSLVPLGFYSKFDSTVTAAPLPLPFGFSLLDGYVEAKCEETSYDYNASNVLGKYSTGVDSQGIYSVGLGVWTATTSTPLFTLLYPGIGRLSNITSMATVTTPAPHGVFAGSLAFGSNYVQATVGDPTTAYTQYKICLSVKQRLF